MAAPESALVIMAHPDDLEDFCGGLLASWSHQGCMITSLLLTSGDKGGKDHTLNPLQITALRESEANEAAEILGITNTLFFREPDGELQATLALRKRIMAEIRRSRPEVIVAPDPTRYYVGGAYINHPDHRAAGEAILAATSPGANNLRYFPELLAQGLEPHQAKEVWLTTPTEPNVVIDITAWIELKIAAFLCHASQFTDANQVRERMLADALTVGEDGARRYTEAFRVMHIG
ncbi:MAG: PIG-L deacetylase family protein [Anaerolineae bacterium]